MQLEDGLASADSNERLSLDQKWRSFVHIPNLLQYVATGAYFARVKINGKIFRRSLKTQSRTTAKLRLLDFLKEQRTAKPEKGEPVTFKEARLAYESRLESDYSLSPETKRYRGFCLKALAKSWPSLDEQKIAEITEGECRDWASRFSATVDERYFNNVVGTLKAVLEIGIREHISDGGSPLANPAKSIKPLGVKPKTLKLPERDQFNQILVTIESAGAPQSRACANLVRFLAYSGCRISEARQVAWQDVNWGTSTLRVVGAKKRRVADEVIERFVPIVPDMKVLLEQLRQKNSSPNQSICEVGECEKSLTRACKVLGIPRITHHDLRHLFATRCIESGVDIPTVSRWLGHKDGGALAMKVYGHLRNEHSQAMAQKVRF